jgi:hypothetical protein
MRHYRIKEEVYPHGSVYYPQYKDDDCAGYANWPKDPDANLGITEYSYFLIEKTGWPTKTEYHTTDIRHAQNMIYEDMKFELERQKKYIKIVYHEIPIEPQSNNDIQSLIGT